MTISDSTRTTGTFQAEITRASGTIEKYVGDKHEMKQYYSEGILTLSSTKLVGGQRVEYRDLDIHLPDDGDIHDKVYTVQSAQLPTPGSNLAYATWWVRGFSYASPFTGSAGTIKVTVDKKAQTAQGTFSFQAKGLLPGETVVEGVEVKSGSFSLQGLYEGARRLNKCLFTPTEDNACGHFKADITGHIFHKYEANRFSLDWSPGSISIPVPHWRGSSSFFNESSIPNVTVDVLNLVIADDLGPGTYDLIKHKDEISAFYGPFRGPIGYFAISGELTITSTPPKGSSVGVLAGKISFEAESTDKLKTIQVINEQFRIERIQRPA